MKCGGTEPGCISEKKVEETRANIKEAIELYLEPVEDDSVLVEIL